MIYYVLSLDSHYQIDISWHHLFTWNCKICCISRQCDVLFKAILVNGKKRAISRSRQITAWTCNVCHTLPWWANIARTHAHAEVAHFPMRRIIRTWGGQGCRPGAFQVLMMHKVGKCVISAWPCILAFIPWPMRNIKAAMHKLRISSHPFSAGIVSWSWDKNLSYFTPILYIVTKVVPLYLPCHAQSYKQFHFGTIKCNVGLFEHAMHSWDGLRCSQCSASQE